MPPAYLAKHLQALARAGVVESVAGARGGYRLTRPATEITVLEVVEAIEGRGPPLPVHRDPPARPGSPPPGAAEFRAPCAIARTMRRAEDAYRRELAAETLADLVVGLGRVVTAATAQRFAEWYGDIRRPTPRMSAIALVLGAGGVVGAAFHAGVIAALDEHTGWDARTAALVVGTSAGSGIGATVRAGSGAGRVPRARATDGRRRCDLPTPAARSRPSARSRVPPRRG